MFKESVTMLKYGLKHSITTPRPVRTCVCGHVAQSH